VWRGGQFRDAGGDGFREEGGNDNDAGGKRHESNISEAEDGEGGGNKGKMKAVK